MDVDEEDKEEEGEEDELERDSNVGPPPWMAYPRMSTETFDEIAEDAGEKEQAEGVRRGGEDEEGRGGEQE